MIQIEPSVDYSVFCPNCGTRLFGGTILWQGIHVCVVSICGECGLEIVSDLPIGHAIMAPYSVDCKNNKIFGNESDKNWIGLPFLMSLMHPSNDFNVQLEIERFLDFKEVIILNCIDFLYGHALLKLLNAQMHLDEGRYGVIVLVQQPFRWLVPKGVAEVWTVNIPLSCGQNHYPDLNLLIKNECKRFSAIYLSNALPHPSKFEIQRFSKITPHDFTKKTFRITFVWRDDRLWCRNNLPVKVIRKLPSVRLLLIMLQNYKVRHLFSILRKSFPSIQMTVVGLGKSTVFPAWVDDRRVEIFDQENERLTCTIYSESRLVIGVHGSNMLLPSAHAGLTLNIMPDERWGNFAQDIAYQENNPRLAAYRYRYIPVQTGIRCISRIAVEMINNYNYYVKQMTM